ncbi:MAG: cytochrome c1 [Proteobacteria bacterium]|nr:cytochrome c1 [Pseudomonadota bacterium]
MRKLSIGVAAALLFGLQAGAALAAEGKELPERDWSFSGIFGQFDRGAMQRGLQVYREVCSGCHGLRFIAFRNLAALGYGEDEIKAIAADYSIVDGPNEEGEMFERPGRPSDRFPSPFPNDKAAAANNNGAVPPDLSLIVKARTGGADYVHGLLTGYAEPPEGLEILEGQNYNLYFPGNVTAMAPPLFEDAVEYGDGTPATVEQMATDVATFLAWTAEPEMEERKSMGIGVMLFLLVFTGVLYAVKRKVWADLH